MYCPEHRPTEFHPAFQARWVYNPCRRVRAEFLGSGRGERKIVPPEADFSVRNGVETVDRGEMSDVGVRERFTTNIRKALKEDD